MPRKKHIVAPRRRAAAAPLTRHRTVASGHTREDILVAAARVLGRRGFGSISMQDIAREVGFSAPALYGYFGSKEEIFAALFATLERELEATFAPPPPRLSFRGRVSCLVRRQLEWSDRRRDVFLAFMAAHGRGDDHPHPAHAAGEPPRGPAVHLARLAAWLGEAAPDPADLHGLDADEVACILMGVSYGFFLRWLVFHPEERLADQTERIVEAIFHGLSGPPTPAASRPVPAARPGSRLAARPGSRLAARPVGRFVDPGERSAVRRQPTRTPPPRPPSARRPRGRRP